MNQFLNQRYLNHNRSYPMIHINLDPNYPNKKKIKTSNKINKFNKFNKIRTRRMMISIRIITKWINKASLRSRANK